METHETPSGRINDEHDVPLLPAQELLLADRHDTGPMKASLLASLIFHLDLQRAPPVPPGTP